MVEVKTKTKGSFTKTIEFLKRRKINKLQDLLNYYGELGVKELKKITPKKTGLTSESWYYTTEIREGHSTLRFNNLNVVDGQNIAILIDTGHASKKGNYIEGYHYIEPAIQPILSELADKIWKEVRDI